MLTHSLTLADLLLMRALGFVALLSIAVEVFVCSMHDARGRQAAARRPGVI